jgi:WD40 repeat protein
MTLRDTRPGTILIAALVAAGAWYAKYPDTVERLLPPLQSGIETQNRPSLVHASKVYWSPEGRKLLSVVCGEFGMDGPLALHDLDNLPCCMPIDLSGEAVVTAVLAPDGRHVLVATQRGHLWWIGLESDERLLLLELREGIAFSSAAVSADGRQVVAACTNGSIILCDLERPVPVVIASGLLSQLSEIRFSSDGRRLVSAGQDGWLGVWELPSGKLQHRWKAHEQPAMAAAFLSDNRIISAGLDDTIRMWDISTGREMWRGDFGQFGVLTLAVSADGKSAAWGGFDRKVIVWDLANSRKKCEIQLPERIVRDLKFSPDSNWLAVAGNGGRVRVHDAHFGFEVAEIELGLRL